MYRRVGLSYRCVKCDESFRTEGAALRQSSQCRTHATSTLFVDRAVVCAKTHIQNRTISVHTKASESEALQSMVFSGDVKRNMKFPPFWAVRPVSGIRRGSNLIEPFRKDIEAMVEQGNEDKSHKLSNGQMQE